jgi:hypothetical protein
MTGDLWPPRVSRKGDKEGRLAKVANNSHRILKQLLHKPIPTRKGGWKDKSPAKVSWRDIFTDESIRQAVVDIRTNLILVPTKPVKGCCLTGHERINNILLK